MTGEKKTRGSKPSCPWDKQYDELQKYPIFYDDDKVKEKDKHSAMWKEICTALYEAGYRITPHTLRNNVAQNRHNLKTDLLAIRGNKVQKLEATTVKTNDDNSSGIAAMNDFDALQELHRDGLLRPLFRGFSSFKFSLSFWSDEAIRLSKCFKSELICVFGKVGNLTENFVHRDKYVSETVVCYCLGAITDNELLAFTPLCHLLTEHESKIVFKSFMWEIFRKGFQTPLKISLNFRLADLQAITMSVNTNYTYEKYMSTGFLCLSQKESHHLPKCQIIADLQMIFDGIKNWMFEPEDLVEYFQDFFVDVVRLLHFQTSLDGFKKWLKSLLILTVSVYENELTKKNLRDIQIKCAKLPDEQSSNVNRGEGATTLDIDRKQCSKIIEFLDSIHQEACKEIEATAKTERKNAFFSEILTKNILDLCLHFITWTRVLDDKYEQNVSDSKLKKPDCKRVDSDPEDSESQARPSTSVLQKYHDDFLLTLPMDVTSKLKIADYVKRTINLTENQICTTLEKLGSHVDHELASVYSNHDNKEQVPIELDNEKSFLSLAENWMGLNASDAESKSNSSECESSSTEVEQEAEESSSHKLINHNQLKKKSRKSKETKKRGQLLEPCSDFFLFKRMPKQLARKRLVIKNANRVPVTIDKFSVTFVDTSMFDSILEILVSSFYLIEKLQHFLERNSSVNEFFSIIENYAIQLKINKEFYEKRAGILKRLMNAQFRNKLYWQKNLASFVDAITTPSISIRRTCQNCNLEESGVTSTFKMTFQNVTESLNKTHSTLPFLPAQCSSCGCEIDVDITVQNYFFVDVEDDNTGQLENINTIPLDITVSQNNFALTGVVGYEVSLIEPHTRHYTAYCLKAPKSKTGTRIWSVFDNSVNRLNTKKNQQMMVRPALVIFIEYEASIAKAEAVDEQQGNGNIEMASFNDKSIENFSANSHEDFIINQAENLSCRKNNSSLDLTFENEIPVSTSTPEFQKKVKNILTIDLDNAKLKDEDKDKTKFFYKDLNCAILSWETPPYVTQIISNASMQPNIKFKLEETTVALKFINTCSIDSIVESLTHCYRESVGFCNELEKHKNHNENLEAVSHYALFKDMDRFYFYRSKAMFVRVPTYIDGVYGPTKDCTQNLCSLFRHMMSGYPSITINGVCACGVIQTRSEYASSVNYVSFFQEGIENIGVLLQRTLLSEKMSCLNEACRKPISNISINLSNYIAFDLELIHETENEKRLGKHVGIEIENFRTNLNDIPKSITLYHQKFVLKAVIEFQELTKTFLHYISYCRSVIDNREIWMKYNDSSTDAVKVRPENLPPLKIALVIYTFSSSETC